VALGSTTQELEVVETGQHALEAELHVELGDSPTATVFEVGEASSRAVVAR
jgi:hypothetical protein